MSATLCTCIWHNAVLGSGGPWAARPGRSLFKEERPSEEHFGECGDEDSSSDSDSSSDRVQPTTEMRDGVEK